MLSRQSIRSGDIVIRPPRKGLSGEITLPGDKSISHRAAMIAAISGRRTLLRGYSDAADCTSTLNCLRALGVAIDQQAGDVLFHGAAAGCLRAPEVALDCGNSGTTMRLLAGILAGQNFGSTLTGDHSLMSRPMGRIAEPLRLMGASVDMTDGHAPLRITGARPLRGIEYRSAIASAQVKSCVILAGLAADGPTVYTEPVLTRDHTERLLRSCGVHIATDTIDGGVRHVIEPLDRLTCSDEIVVPGDVSSAAFFVAAACLVEGSEIRLKRVGLNPHRTSFIDLLIDAGMPISIEPDGDLEANGEPAGDILVRSDGNTRHISLSIEGKQVAGLIDEIPIAAVLATQTGGIEVRDADELRHKETDRIAAVVTNLEKMGADVEEFADGFRVGRSRLKGAVLDSFGDHRIAMAFAIAGLLADEGETIISGGDCVDISFPGFFRVLFDAVS